MKANNFMSKEYKTNKISSTNTLNRKKEAKKLLQNLEFKMNLKGSDYLKNAILNLSENNIKINFDLNKQKTE